MLDYNKTYKIGETFSNRPFRGVIENYDLAEPEISRGEKLIIETVSVKHSMGGKTLYDIIWTTNAFPLIISERIVELFNSNGITGWKTYDVEIRSKKNDLIDQKYFGLIITGRCGYRDYAKSSIILDEIGVNIKPHVKGFYFKDDYWDGSDLFMSNPEENGNSTMFRFCTDKVVNLFKKEKIKNIEFENLNESTLAIELYNVPLTDKQKSEMENLKASR
ncbi:hypothetical protein L3X37_11285 [Sabulilitoribacter arenilitoris]|uniref:Uncharacterized protein n=1 Tax=Wocania arenilitoris TaxID=2044858 RepID=A0AAE3ENY2_9FLAO|nr:hypothetical protein [Wocania arenilitoris]MCF7568940.1 hypothetical protein [Wocania arenilitoris]